MYSLKLIHGFNAAVFLEEWNAGGLEIRPDVIGAYRTVSGRGSSANLQKEIELWQLKEVRFSFKDMLQIGFLTVWHWTDVGWVLDQDDRSKLWTSRPYRRLREQLGAGIRSDKDRAAVLKLVVGLTRYFGEPEYVQGIVEQQYGENNAVTVYRQGLVNYDAKPHPTAFLKDLADALVPVDD